MEQPLTSCRVLDLADVKGAYCGRLLADLGADVTKVEPPQGDPMRSLGPFAGDAPHPDKSLLFAYYNANKRGITLNLERGRGQELFRKLVSASAVVVETFPPGYLDELGLDDEALQALNPGLIHTSITGLGLQGPYRGFQAADLIAFAMGGLMSYTGRPDGPPTAPPAYQACLLGSTQAAFGTLLALYNRSRTGRGQRIEVSLQEVVAALDHQITRYSRDVDLMRRQGSQSPVAPGRVYPCKDGFIHVFINSPEHWRRFRAWIGEPEALQGEAWDVTRFRRLNIDIISPHIVSFTLKKTRQELYEEGQALHLPVAPIYTTEEFVSCPQVQERAYFQELTHPVLGSLPFPGPPYRFSRELWTLRCPAPRLREHNEEVYVAELGLPLGEAEALRQEGVL